MRIYGNNCKVKQTQGAQGIISLRTLRNLGKLCVYCILIFNARSAKVFARDAKWFCFLLILTERQDQLLPYLQPIHSALQL